MRKKYKTITVRFDANDKEQLKAWEYLKECKGKKLTYAEVFTQALLTQPVKTKRETTLQLPEDTLSFSPGGREELIALFREEMKALLDDYFKDLPNVDFTKNAFTAPDNKEENKEPSFEPATDEMMAFAFGFDD